MNVYKKRIIDMNKVLRLQERRMIGAFFNENKKKRKPIIKKEPPIIPLTNQTKGFSQKTVHVFNIPTTRKKSKPSTIPKKTAYQMMLNKAEQIRIRWRKKKEAIQAKQIKSSPTPKQTNRLHRSKVDEIREKWKKKGATID